MCGAKLGAKRAVLVGMICLTLLVGNAPASQAATVDTSITKQSSRLPCWLCW